MNAIALLPKTLPKQTRWGQLHGPALALALAEWCQQTTGIKLLIAPNHLAAAE